MFESLLANPVFMGGAIIVGRNLFGWFMNSMKDGKIDEYEWGQLGQTIVKLAGMSVFLYFGIGAIVPGVDAEASTALAALIDILKSEFKKNK